MSTPTEIHNRILKDINGLETYTDTTGVTAGAVIQSLIDLIEPQYTQEQRGHLDQMSPTAHRQLLAELVAIKAVIDLWDAPA